MPRIQPIAEKNAVPEVSPIFEGLKKALGKVPNLFATIAHSPASLAGLLGWDQALSKGDLSKRELELVNLHISELNGCGYCLSAHSTVGKMVGLSEPEIDAARLGRGANEREDAILALARKVLRTGGAGAEAEVTRLREAGGSDALVIDVLAATALKVFTNAVAIVSKAEIDLPKAKRLPIA